METGLIFEGGGEELPHLLLRHLVHLSEQVLPPPLQEGLPPLQCIKPGLEVALPLKGFFSLHLVPHEGFFEEGTMFVERTEKIPGLAVCEG